MSGLSVALDGHPPVPVASWSSTGPQVEMVRSLAAVLPDPSWAYTDTNGHHHRWVVTDRGAVWSQALPTLTPTSEHRDCDGSCGGVCEGEGYTVIVWRCATCADLVQPGTVPDVEAQTVGVPVVLGPAQFTLTVVRPPVPGARPSSDVYRAELHNGGAAPVTGQAWISEYTSSSEGRSWLLHFLPANR